MACPRRDRKGDMVLHGLFIRKFGVRSVLTRAARVSEVTPNFDSATSRTSIPVMVSVPAGCGGDKLHLGGPALPHKVFELRQFSWTKSCICSEPSQEAIFALLYPGSILCSFVPSRPGPFARPSRPCTGKCSSG